MVSAQNGSACSTYLPESPAWQSFLGPSNFNKSQPLKYLGQNKCDSIAKSSKVRRKSLTVKEMLLFTFQVMGTIEMDFACKSRLVSPELHPVPAESSFKKVRALKPFAIKPLPIPATPLAGAADN